MDAWLRGAVTADPPTSWLPLTCCGCVECRQYALKANLKALYHASGARVMQPRRCFDPLPPRYAGPSKAKAADGRQPLHFAVFLL